MNQREAAIVALESALGHRFVERRRLDLALTHSSVGGQVKDNERLEFLGDRVLGLLAAERLLEMYPEAVEGDLSPRFHSLVDKAACAAVARRMGVGPALRLSPGETKSGGREKDTILADACEAVMAAVYYDGGLDAARAVFSRFWSEDLAHPASLTVKDPKSALQEWAQAAGHPLPAYTVITRTGPDHAPRFVVEARVDGSAPVRAEGRSRQEAEKAAAAAMLTREGLL